MSQALHSPHRTLTNTGPTAGHIPVSSGTFPPMLCATIPSPHWAGESAPLSVHSWQWIVNSEGVRLRGRICNPSPQAIPSLSTIHYSLSTDLRADTRHGGNNDTLPAKREPARAGEAPPRLGKAREGFRADSSPVRPDDAIRLPIFLCHNTIMHGLAAELSLSEGVPSDSATVPPSL